MVCSQSSTNSTKRTSDSMAVNNETNSSNDSSNNDNSSTQSTNENNTRTNENNTRTNANPNVMENPTNAPFLQNFNTFYANPINMSTPAVVLPPDQMWQQMAALQQAYAQYMAQYMIQNPYLNQNQMTPTVIPPMAPMAPMVGPQPVINAPDAGMPVVNAPQPPPVQRLNAGPGGQQVIDDDDEGRNRDWLDCFYWMSRAVVLFSIIYFYSSFTRFLLVVFLSLLLYVYQMNWFNRRQQNINNNRLQQNIVNNNNNNEIGVNRQQQEPNEVDDTEVVDRHQPNANNSVDGRVTEERFTGLRFVWVIVSSLFTSLIPENPAVPVNIN